MALNSKLSYRLLQGITGNATRFSIPTNISELCVYTCNSSGTTTSCTPIYKVNGQWNNNLFQIAGGVGDTIEIKISNDVLYVSSSTGYYYVVGR